MVKIKTKPDTNDHKVTIADLNANILNLTAVVKGNSEIIKAASKNIITNTSSSLDTNNKSKSSTTSSKSKKNSEKSWAAEAGGEVWKATSTQRGYAGSTLLGGLTGLSPAVVQKMGLDKAVGSIFKSVLGGIKKKWAEAGQSSNNKKLNSAIESNKNAGTNKRLDKIIGLLKNKNGVTKTEEKQKQGLFSRILGFVGSILGPLLKIAAAAALLYGIHQAILKLLKHFGVEDVPLANQGGITGATIKSLKNNINKTALPKVKEGIERTSTKIKNVEENIRDINKWNERTKKFTPQERTKALSSEKELEKIAKKKGLSSEEITELKKSRNAIRENATAIKENYTAREQAKIGKTIAENTKKPYNWAERNVVPKTSTGVPVTRTASGLRLANSVNRVGATGLNIANWGLDKAGRAAPYVAIGLTGLEYAMADTQEAKNQAIAGGLGSYYGGKWSGTAAYLANPLSKSPNPWAQGLALAGGVAAAVGGGDVIGDASRYGMSGYDTWRNNKHLNKFDREELIEQEALDIVKNISCVADTFNQPRVKEGESKTWSWFKRYVPILDPWFWKAGGYGTGVLAGKAMDWYREDASPFANQWEQRAFEDKIGGSLSLPSLNFDNPTYGLTTDFEYPIKAADEAAGTTEGIEANTRTTNDYLSDILASLQELKGDASKYQLNRSIENQLSNTQNNTSPSTNTGFPNPLSSDNGLHYVGSHGRMGM